MVVVSSSRGGRPRETTVEDVCEVVERLADRGVLDIAEGGVPTCEIARELGKPLSSTRNLIGEAADTGSIRRVNGINPETLRPRVSYLPNCEVRS